MTERLRYDGPLRPWLDAAAILLLAVVFALMGVSGLWDVLTVVALEPQPWVSVALTAVACVGVGIKYRTPRVAMAIIAVALLADLATGGGLGPLVAALDVVWAATVTATLARRRVIFVVTAMFVLLVVIAVFVRSRSLPDTAIVALQLGALAGTSFWWATAVAQARELAAMHDRQRQAVIAQADRERADALRGERERMARELHDLVAGHVSAVALRAEAALVAGGDDRGALRAVRASAIEAHDAMRSMIAVLRTDGMPVVAPPRIAGIERLVDDARHAGLTVTVAGEVGALPGAIDQAVTRVVQESLANATRHAAGGAVSVSLSADDAAVQVTVRSSGGMAARDLSGSGWGLDLLRERISALGGEFSAGPVGDGNDNGNDDDDGPVWRVSARIPKGTPT